MNKFSSAFVAVALMAVSSLTYAAGNSYCNTRTTQQDMSMCYTQAINTQNSQMTQSLARLDANPKITREWKVKFHKDMQAWSQNVNNVCQRRAVCTYDSLNNQNNRMFSLINESR